MTELQVRAARPDDAEAIAAIYNEAIGERIATFQTKSQDAERFVTAIDRGDVFLVGERDGAVVAAAWVGPYSDPSDYYAGVGEATLYVTGPARRSGIGRELIERLAEAAADHGLYKLVGKVFTTNEPSIAMLRACGWDEVGVHRRHGRLDGEWKDVLVVELLLK